MSQPFNVEKGKRVTIENAQIIFDPAAFALGSGPAADHQKQANVLERRLARIESVLDLEPICDHQKNG